METKNYQDAIAPTIKNMERAAVDIRSWQEGGTSFNCMLLALMNKADRENRTKLEILYPYLGAALRGFHNSSSPAEFYKKYGILNE